MTSPGVSVTWSFDQGVSWFSWLFSDQVNPEPDSDTKKPNEGFATTLTHGSGVRKPSLSTVTYSLPPSANPPNPLKNCNACCGTGASGYFVARGGRGSGGSSGSRSCDRVICSESVPRWLRSTARATVCKCARVCGVIESPRSNTILPLTPPVSGDRRNWLPRTSASREPCKSCT